MGAGTSTQLVPATSSLVTGTSMKTDPMDLSFSNYNLLLSNNRNSEMFKISNKIKNGSVDLVRF